MHWHHFIHSWRAGLGRMGNVWHGTKQQLGWMLKRIRWKCCAIFPLKMCILMPRRSCASSGLIYFQTAAECFDVRTGAEGNTHLAQSPILSREDGIFFSTVQWAPLQKITTKNFHQTSLWHLMYVCLTVTLLYISLGYKLRSLTLGEDSPFTTV